METTKEQRKKGKNMIRGGDGNTFSKENQPTPESKKEGWAKRRHGMELLKFIIQQKFIGSKDGQLKKNIADYFGCPEAEITVEMVMDFRQMEKAIGKSDTPAYKVLKDRLYGQPKQDISLEAEIKKQVYILPDGTEIKF